MDRSSSPALDDRHGVEHDAAGMQIRSGARAASREVGPLGAFYLLSFGALGVHAPYFPLWLEGHGFTGASMSAIAALSPAMSFFGPPIVGAWSDARGARGNLLTRACALAALCMSGLCVAEAVGLSRVFSVVFVTVLLYALCRSPVIMLADRIALEHGGNYGRRRVWGSIGFLLAASALGRLFAEAAWRWIPAVLAALMAVAAAASSRLPRTTSAPLAPDFRDAGRLLRKRRFVAFLGCSALFSASHSSIDLCASLYFRDLGATGSEIGLLWATGVISEIILMTSVGGSLAALRTEALLVLAYAGGALRWFLTSQLRSIELAFFVQPLHAVSFALVWLASLEYLRRTSSPQTFGSAQGLFMAANAMGSVAGMWVWGPLYATSGGSAVFRSATLLGLAAVMLAYGLLFREPRLNGVPVVPPPA